MRALTNYEATDARMLSFSAGEVSTAPSSHSSYVSPCILHGFARTQQLCALRVLHSQMMVKEREEAGWYYGSNSRGE